MYWSPLCVLMLNSFPRRVPKGFAHCRYFNGGLPACQFVCLPACPPACTSSSRSIFVPACLSVLYLCIYYVSLRICIRVYVCSVFFLKHVTLYNRGITIGHAKDQNTRKVRNERLFWIEYHKTMCKLSKNFHVLRANKHKQHISNANENNEYLFFFVERMSPTAILRLFYVHTKKKHYFFHFHFICAFYVFVCPKKRKFLENLHCNVMFD